MLNNMRKESRGLESTPDGCLGHTFHVLKNNAGILWLGVRVQMIEDGKVLGEEVVYGDTLHLVAQHANAERAYAFKKLQGEAGEIAIQALVKEHLFSPRLQHRTQDELQKEIERTNSMLPKRFQRFHNHYFPGQVSGG